MTRDHSPPAPSPEPPQQTGHVAVNDRKSSRADDYAHDNNRSAEGNDASLSSGPSFVRQAHADGAVTAAQSVDDDPKAQREEQPSEERSQDV